MNKKIIRKYLIFSGVFTLILGTLLHFTYDLSMQNPLVATFSATNESVWEHLKLIYFPMLLATIIGLFSIEKNIPNLLCSRTIGIIVAMLFIITFYYTYTGIIGKNFAIIDVSSFVIAIILGEYVSYKCITSNIGCNKKVAIIVLGILLICFILFTNNAPNLEIFRDPITGKIP